MRVIVCGSRDCRTVGPVWYHLDKLHNERKFTALMQGGARGVDRIARDWARTKVELLRYECKAQWRKFGKAGGPVRNRRMLEWKPDLVVAFPGPDSVGTWDMVNAARDAGVEVIVLE